MDNTNIAGGGSLNKSNKILLICFLALVVVNLGLGIFYLYQKAGLKYFISAATKIQKLSEPKKSKAIADFYNKSDGISAYRGILAGVKKSGSGGIWVWGRTGLKYFYADKDSVYLFTDGCFDALINPDPSNVDKEYNLDNEAYTDLGEWSEKVKPGDFVIVISKSDIGFLKGNLGNVLAYNWWYFLQSDMKTECEK